MPISPMLQSKISATKKRLSRAIVQDSSLWTIGFSALALALAYSARVVTAGGSYGVIPMEIPVVSAPFEDRAVHSFRETPDKVIGAHTLLIAITPTEFIFGDMKAFTNAAADVRNKFSVPHADGSPQVSTLLTQVSQWSADRARRLGIRTDRVAVVLPDTRVPVAVLAHVADHLRKSGMFDHLVMAGGML